MPTTLPRHTLTETPEVADALAAAARRWPEDRDQPARLLRHLVDEGRRVIDEAEQARIDDRLAAIRETSGIFRGVYEHDYLERLREDWPD